VLTRARAGVASGLAIAAAAILTTGSAAVGAQAAPVTYAAHAGARGQEAGRHGAGKRSDDKFPAQAKSRLAAEMRQAWHVTRGKGVTIALLSTAVDAVTGLSGKLTTGPDYAPLAGGSATDGTVLASLIAGSGPAAASPFGSIGRAPAARILAERIVDYNSRGGARYQKAGTWQVILARAIRYAVNHGADVIVTFESGDADSAGLESAVEYAVSRNVVVLGSSDSTGGKPTTPAYPDSSPGVINFTGQILAGLPKPAKPVSTPANSSVLVTAPDNVQPETGPGSQPYTAWGNYTDIAWVAGTVALIKSVYPRITPAQVALALAESASYHPRGGYDTTVGFGLLNPAGALHDAGRISQLGLTAAPGPGVAGAQSRFGTPQSAVISAVHHSAAVLAGYGAAIVAGLILLTFAIMLAVRSRRAALPGR
jgi:hypothetical protein